MSLPTRELQADRRQSIITQGILCLETSKVLFDKRSTGFCTCWLTLQRCWADVIAKVDIKLISKRV